MCCVNKTFFWDSVQCNNNSVKMEECMKFILYGNLPKFRKGWQAQKLVAETLTKSNGYGKWYCNQCQFSGNSIYKFLDHTVRFDEF